MDINGEEEHGRARSMGVANEPAIIDIAHDVLDAFKRIIDMRHIMHRENDSRDELHAQTKSQDSSKGPPVIKISRRRIGQNPLMHKA